MVLNSCLLIYLLLTKTLCVLLSYVITAGSDYSPAVGEPVFLQFDASNDDQQLCVSFGIINDPDPENAEFFCVTLTSNEPAGSVIVDPSSAPVTIIDDDGKKSHSLHAVPSVSYNHIAFGDYLSLVHTHKYKHTDPCVVLLPQCHPQAVCTIQGLTRTCECIPPLMGNGFDCQSKSCKCSSFGIELHGCQHHHADMFSNNQACTQRSVELVCVYHSTRNSVQTLWG